MTPRTVVYDAAIEGDYRWWLTRAWAPGRRLTFIMLNPSTADASADDPTIRRCMAFAERDGFGGIMVVNLYALRATNPERLYRRDAQGVNAGLHNATVVAEAIRNAHKAVAAWGNHSLAQAPAVDVRRIATQCGTPLYALGINKNGSPKHPLYVKADAPLVLYHGREPDTPAILGPSGVEQSGRSPVS